jgi:hypothetical protein
VEHILLEILVIPRLPCVSKMVSMSSSRRGGTKLQNHAIAARFTVAKGVVKSSVPVATMISLLLSFTKRNVNRIFSTEPSYTSSSVLVGTSTASARRTVEQEAVRHLQRGHTVVGL